MKKSLILAMIALLSVGCSTSHVELPVEVALDSAEMSPGVMLPYTIEVVDAPMDGGVALTLVIHYHRALSAEPLLTIETYGDTEIANMAQVTRLETPTSASEVRKTLLLRGLRPSVDIMLSILEGGFAFEMHESYPPKVRALRSTPEETPLPSPIEVDGVEIDSGIEIP